MEINGESDAFFLHLCRGFPVKKSIMLKHLSKEPEGVLGSQSPPAKRVCPDLEVKNTN